MKNIKHFLETTKGESILIIFIIILTSLISFELGRFSVDSNSGIKLNFSQKKDKILSSSAINAENFLKINPNLDRTNNINTSKSFFASKRGKKYYPIGCSAGKSIKQNNKIFFDSKEKAEKAGYTLSNSCR